MEMTKEQAKKYLERKGKVASKEEIEKVMTQGKIYGDPMVDVKF